MLRQFSSQHPTPLMLLCLKKIFLMAKKLSMLKHQYIIKYCLQSLWVCVLSRVPFFATLWTLAHQSPLSLGFTRQEHWSGLPFPSPMHEREKLLPMLNSSLYEAFLSYIWSFKKKILILYSLMWSRVETGWSRKIMKTLQGRFIKNLKTEERIEGRKKSVDTTKPINYG